MINNLVLFIVNVSIIDVWLPPKGLNEFSNQHMIFHTQVRPLRLLLFTPSYFSDFEFLSEAQQYNISGSNCFALKWPVGNSLHDHKTVLYYSFNQSHANTVHREQSLIHLVISVVSALLLYLDFNDPETFRCFTGATISYLLPSLCNSNQWI